MHRQARLQRDLWKTHNVLVSFSVFETKEVAWLRWSADAVVMLAADSQLMRSRAWVQDVQMHLALAESQGFQTTAPRRFASPASLWAACLAELRVVPKVWCRIGRIGADTP